MFGCTDKLANDKRRRHHGVFKFRDTNTFGQDDKVATRSLVMSIALTGHHQCHQSLWPLGVDPYPQDRSFLKIKIVEKKNKNASVGV